jgi:transcriptional regulator with XRE-family HTH domain
MSEISKIIGQRIRSYRTVKGLSQEKLAELSGCHPTYIGQLERGEKNATLESIEKISLALNVSLSQLFENIGDCSVIDENLPLLCYEMILQSPKKEQRIIFNIISEISKLNK